MADYPRKFLPSDWMDEFMPSPQADVNTFIRKMPNGEFWLGPCGDEWEDYENYQSELSDGQVIKFSALETYAAITLKVSEDDFTTFPPNIVRANNFRLEQGDYEDVWDSLSDLVDNSGDSGRLAEGSYQVECWWWSEEDFAYRFTIDADGNGRLDPCAGAN